MEIRKSKITYSKEQRKSKITYLKEQRKKKILQEQERVEKLSNKLNRHTTRNKNTEHINHKIFHLLHDPFTFVNAYAKISKNKGALTRGHQDKRIMELFGLKQAKEIAKDMRAGQYKFGPVKRTWIPKPGKKKKRPIDVPSQKDRIVQEATRGILEAIYEPEFEELGIKTNGLSNNYGFRPELSTWSAIEKLNHHSKRCSIVIEGDIVSAYNNVDHDILLNILKKRIKDKKFLKLIKNMLKSGIMDKGMYEHSLIGTPQGGIVSPLLFNIYMLDLDKYIYDEFIQPIIKKNVNKYTYKSSKSYEKLRRQEKKQLIKLKKLKNKNPKNQTEIKKAQKEFKRIRSSKFNTPSGDIAKLKKGAVYVRYADDWVLALTCTKMEAENVKKKIANFLKIQRKMELDVEKTKITHTTEGYKFLGFEIRLRQTKPKIRRVLAFQPDGTYNRPLKRTTSRMITIEPDSDRILNRLKINKFCDKEYMPIGKAAWTVFDDFQIVEKYSQIFRGIYNYYEPCQRLQRLSRISYILQYSCAKTLAKRKKTSIRKIFKKYTKNMEVETTIRGLKKENTRKIRFLELSDLRKIKINRKDSSVEFDPFRIKEFWRTKIKLYNECCICGETEEIALHHLNSISSIKDKKKDRFEKIRSQIHRLQIPVCKVCHLEITHGKYNNPKKPIEFYNEFIAKL